MGNRDTERIKAEKGDCSFIFLRLLFGKGEILFFILYRIGFF